MGLRKFTRKKARKIQRLLAKPTRLNQSKLNWLLDRPPIGPVAGVFTDGCSVDDTALVDRIMHTYKLSNRDFVASDSFWDSSIFRLNRDIHDALMGEDKATAAQLLRNPDQTSHFWGFDLPAAAPAGETEPHQSLLENLDVGMTWQEMMAIWTYDKLRTLAEALGACRLHYPESPKAPQQYDVEELLVQIEEKLGTTLTFPNPFAGEFGLPTSRGVVSFRALQSLYQGWRIAQIAGQQKEKFKVLEIGAGLGRTAYFANCFGISDYTIIDIPMTGAAQGYYLGRTLGEAKVSLNGDRDGASVNIVPASDLGSMNQKFDLIVNVDSMTEMAADTMMDYWNFILGSTPRFLSINHHANDRSVSELIDKNPSISVTRSPYWMRRGYTEEYILIG